MSLISDIRNWLKTPDVVVVAEGKIEGKDRRVSEVLLASLDNMKQTEYACFIAGTRKQLNVKARPEKGNRGVSPDSKTQEPRIR